MYRLRRRRSSGLEMPHTSRGLLEVASTASGTALKKLGPPSRMSNSPVALSTESRSSSAESRRRRKRQSRSLEGSVARTVSSAATQAIR